MTATFRCSTASRITAEPMVGTAPTERAYLCVEYAGPWGRKALAESRLPTEVRDHLAGLDGVRVLLVRRHGGMPGARPSRARDERATERAYETGPGVRVFAGWVGAGGPWLETTVLDHHGQLLDLDLDGLAAGRSPGLTPYHEPLWLVCTNGRRDRCCAEIGRPIASALAARWPHETWETTHLGGHRFAGTLLALHAGVCLGRLSEESAVAACRELDAGRYLAPLVRGMVGLGPAAQVAAHAVRERTDCWGLDAVVVHQVVADEPGNRREEGPMASTVVTGRVGDRRWRVVVTEEPGPERAQSCGDPAAVKPTVWHRASAVHLDA